MLRGGAAGPAISVDVEEPASNALHSSPEFVQLPTKPATEDTDDDIELLRRVVHNIQTLVEKVPETSEVCWTMFSISQGHSHTPFIASALRKHCLGSHVLSARGMDGNSCLISVL